MPEDIAKAKEYREIEEADFEALEVPGDINKGD